MVLVETGGDSNINEVGVQIVVRSCKVRKTVDPNKAEVLHT